MKRFRLLASTIIALGTLAAPSFADCSQYFVNCYQAGYSGCEGNDPSTYIGSFDDLPGLSFTVLMYCNYKYNCNTISVTANSACDGNYNFATVELCCTVIQD
ncbi:MAG: hypothetical protein ABI165_17545 [Bryobacteraceae bacterium]